MGYAEKRGKTWRAHWQTDQVDAKGRKVEGTESGFPTKTAAENYADDQEAAIRAGTWIDPKRGKIPFAQWWEEWFDAQEWRPNTCESYRQQWNRHIGPRWGRTPLRAIRPIEIEKWLKELRAVLSPSSVTVIVSAMRGALAAAVENELIPRSPMPAPGKRGRKRPVSPKQQRVGVVVTPLEIEAILLRLKDDAERLMVITTVFTGMRWSEVSGMRRAYLDLAPPAGERPACGTYTIDALDGAVHEDVHSNRYVGPPKSGGERVMDLPPFLVLLLLAYLAGLPRGQEILFPDTRGHFRRYDTWNTLRWRQVVDGRPAAVSRGGRSIREAVPPIRPGLRFHDLKHTHAAMLNDQRVHPVMRDYRLGHAQPGAPGVYAHPTPQMRRELVEALEAQWRQWGLDLAQVRERAGGSPTKSLPSGGPGAHSANVLF